MFLMCRNVPVIEFDEEQRFRVITPELVPIGVRMEPTWKKLFGWLTARSMSLVRIHAGVLLHELDFGSYNQWMIVHACQGVTLTDSYWLRDDEQDVRWEDVNFWQQPFSEQISQLSLTGQLTGLLTGRRTTPELLTQGDYAKCWHKEADGIYLYKANTKFGNEAQIEIICSQMLAILGWDHVAYEQAELFGVETAKCAIVTDECRSFVSFAELENYVPNAVMWMLHNRRQPFQRMLLFDGIVHNTDRHAENWGIYMDATNGELMDFFPLFDHNCAIHIGAEQNSYIYPQKTLLEVAKWAYKKLDYAPELQLLLEWFYQIETKKMFQQRFGGMREYHYILRRLILIMNEQ